MIPTPYQKYQQSSVQTASPGQLVIMLYDGAIRFVKQSIEAIKNKDIQKANHFLLKAQTVIHELVASVDIQYPISKQLLQIYEYMMHRLIQANVNKNSEAADEVLSYLTDLKEAWLVAVKSTTQMSQNYNG
ncbi:flagellar export chaperone FliS [Paenibacillus sepulcri]|uniref:Flagellar secretion chaperone FliS n=1 Tax=Paenibacillus sepulcri TaxID=359917 RepID=A0ABS7BVI0_9BACL|nr:flagellar export chaperone FliS [Paenibacillus sepulcri]